MEWIEFLERVAIKHKLTAEQQETLIDRLDGKNNKKSNIRIAADLNISESEIKKRLSDIYKIFEPICPDLASSQSRGKVAALRACLWQQYERSASPSPPAEPVGTPSNLPLSGVVKFVGREKALKTVHEQLQEATAVAISSVSGMGGVGKTELALQYAYGKLREAAYPGGICWVNVRAQDVGIGILEFARVQLGLPQPPETLKTVPQQVEWVCRRWRGEPILVVLDDVVKYAAVKPYLDKLDARFRVLMTTRLQLGTAAKRLELPVLEPDAALELLRVLVEDAERIDSQLEDAKRLCQWLGYLPLGLELVGRYLARKRDLSLAQMLARLQEKSLAAKALVKTDADMTAQLGVAAAFELSWEELPEEARVLSGLLSLLGVTPIPWGLIEQCLPDWDGEELEDCRDEQLVGRSLLARIEPYTYQLHPLIREFFIAKLLQNDPHLTIASIARNAPAVLAYILVNKGLNLKLTHLKAGSHMEPLELAKQFKLAIESWEKGFSPLSNQLLPINENGKIEALGIKLLPGGLPEIYRIIICLKNRYPLNEEIVELPKDLNYIKDYRLQDWRFQTIFDLTTEINWCWNWGFKKIKLALTRLINERQLKLTEGSLLHERAWRAAYLLTGRHSANFFRPDPIPVQDIVSSVSYAKSTSLYYQWISYTDLEHLEIVLKELIEKDREYFDYPWQQRDSQDEDILLSYVNGVYSSSLQAYDNLVECYFKPLNTRNTDGLKLASFLLCQVRGYLILQKRIVSWLWFPLSTAQEALDKERSDITIGNLEIDSDDRIFSEAMERTRQSSKYQKNKFHLRKDYYSRPSITVRSQDPTVFSHRFPVSALVYQWLWEDLQDLSLVEGRFEDKLF